MTRVSVLVKNRDCKLKALRFDFPVLFKAYFEDLVGYVKDAFCIVPGNRIQYIERVYSNVCLWILESNQCVVEEHIEPLLVEGFFLCNKESVAGIHDLI